MENSNKYAKINNVCLVLLTIVALAAALIYTRPVLVPFVLSIFIYAAISPVLVWFQYKWRLSRIFSVALTSLLFLGLSFGLILLIILSFEDFFSGADLYKAKIGQLVKEFVLYADSKGFPIDYDLVQQKLNEFPIFSYLKSFTGGFFSFLGNIVLIIIFVIFFIAGETTQEKRHPLMSEVQSQISQYIRVKLMVSLLTGVLVGVILTIFGVELTLMFAILTVLLNFIPNIGPIIASALPIPVLLLQFGLGWEFIFILSATGIIQFIIGNILEPKWLGGSLDQHPISVLFFLMFWGLVWGIPGMFLSVPIMAFLKIVFERIETTKPLAKLITGRLS